MIPATAGERDRFVTIQQAASARGAQGGVVITYTGYATAWAKKMPQASSEYFQGEQITADQLTTFKTDFIPGLKPTMRLIDGADVYDIIGASEIGRQQGSEIHCKLLVAP
jgi:head-tail adaptor